MNENPLLHNSVCSQQLKPCRCSSFLNEFPQMSQNTLSTRLYSKHSRPKHGSKYSSESESDSDLEEVGHRVR